MSITKKITAVFLAAVMFTSCDFINDIGNNTSKLNPFDDMRSISNKNKGIYESDKFDPENIITYWFNADNVFIGNEEQARAILEAGKNPGLGVRSLHEQGITGEGVRVAIVDQNLALTHPEYKDKLIAYYDVGTRQSQENGSMHGPAVASLLVGDECGTAPGAVLYFAAAPSWTQDSKYQADALRWVIEENEKLPAGDKIRVVSISGAPSGNGTPFKKNMAQWDMAVAEAKEAGILVLDCRDDPETGFVSSAYYDPSDPDDISLIKPGYPSSSVSFSPDTGWLLTPTSYRTTAEEYSAGVNSWQYTGQGGRSWSIPYAAGVLAMGWQVNPELSNEEIVRLLFDSAYVDDKGYQYINPPEFIKAVQATVGEAGYSATATRHTLTAGTANG